MKYVAIFLLTFLSVVAHAETRSFPVWECDYFEPDGSHSVGNIHIGPNVKECWIRFSCDVTTGYVTDDDGVAHDLPHTLMIAEMPERREGTADLFTGSYVEEHMTMHPIGPYYHYPEVVWVSIALFDQEGYWYYPGCVDCEPTIFENIRIELVVEYNSVTNDIATFGHIKSLYR